MCILPSAWSIGCQCFHSCGICTVTASLVQHVHKLFEAHPKGGQLAAQVPHPLVHAHPATLCLLCCGCCGFCCAEKCSAAVTVPVGQSGTYPATVRKPQAFWAPFVKCRSACSGPTTPGENGEALTAAWLLEAADVDRTVTVSTCGQSSIDSLLAVWLVAEGESNEWYMLSNAAFSSQQCVLPLTVHSVAPAKPIGNKGTHTRRQHARTQVASHDCRLTLATPFIALLCVLCCRCCFDTQGLTARQRSKSTAVSAYSTATCCQYSCCSAHPIDAFCSQPFTASPDMIYLKHTWLP